MAHDWVKRPSNDDWACARCGGVVTFAEAMATVLHGATWWGQPCGVRGAPPSTVGGASVGDAATGGPPSPGG